MTIVLRALAVVNRDKVHGSMEMRGVAEGAGEVERELFHALPRLFQRFLQFIETHAKEIGNSSAGSETMFLVKA
jgi:hypothetical protein